MKPSQNVHIHHNNRGKFRKKCLPINTGSGLKVINTNYNDTLYTRDTEHIHREGGGGGGRVSLTKLQTIRVDNLCDCK